MIMAKNETNKKILYAGLTGIFILFVIGIILVNRQEPIPEYAFPEPVEVVRQYFSSWDKEDYSNMYATFSDGFKHIEPSTKNLSLFKQYVQSQQISGVDIIRILEKSNDGSTATVEYAVEFVLNDDSKKPFEGAFTLKYRTGDVIRGWKLIHPYGENIDKS